MTARMTWLGLAIATAVALGAAFDVMTPGRVGFQNDDAVYATTARALAAGEGYIHPFDPGHGPANRYPIGYPLLLAPIARVVADPHTQLIAMQGLSLLCFGAFLVLAFLVLARIFRFPPAVAAGLVAMTGLHPGLVRYASQVMADMPFAAGSMAVWLGCAHVLEDEGFARKPRPWALIGLAMAALVLLRYQGAALIAATGLFLLWRRSWPAVAGFTAGAVGPLVVYMTWSVARGGFWYAEVSQRFGGQLEAADHLMGLAASARFLFLRAVPGAIAGPLAPPSSGDPLVMALAGWEMGLAIALVALVAMGLVDALRTTRHQASQTALQLVALYTVVSLALVLAWNGRYFFLGYMQAVRLTLPLLPLLLGFAALALANRLQGPSRAAVAVALMAGIAVNGATHLAYRAYPLFPRGRAEAYMAAFAQAREIAAPGAVFGSTMPAMVYLYTGIPGAPFPLDDPAAFARVARGTHFTGLFLPRGLYGYLANGQDPLEVLIAGVTARYPGALTLAYRDPVAKLEIWTVNPSKLR